MCPDNVVEKMSSTLEAIKLSDCETDCKITRKRRLEIPLTKIEYRDVKKFKSIVQDTIIGPKLASGSLVWGFCNGWYPGTYRR